MAGSRRQPQAARDDVEDELPVIMQPAAGQRGGPGLHGELASDYLDDRARTPPGPGHRSRRPPARRAAARVLRRRERGRAAGHGRLRRQARGRIDPDALSAEHQVDAAHAGQRGGAADLRARRAARARTWNPLVANPGRAIHLLLARDFAPLPDRLASVAGRLGGDPGGPRPPPAACSGRMPKVHLETAIGQFSGTIRLVTGEIDAALEAAPGCAGADRARCGRPRSRRWPSTGPGWRRSWTTGGDGIRRPADRPRAVRPQAVPHPGRRGRRRRDPGPGAGRPRPGQRGDRPAGRRAGRAGRAGWPGGRRRAGPAGARPAGGRRRRTTRRSWTSAATRSPRRPASSRSASWSPCTTTRSR